MTCESMLELMLEADPEELEGRGTSALALHVRTCARCRAVAQQLVIESQLLAVSLRRASVTQIGSFAARTRFPRRLMVGGGVFAVAASLLLFFLVDRGANQHPDITASPSVAHAPEFRPQGVAPPRPGMAGGLEVSEPSVRVAPVLAMPFRYGDSTRVAQASRMGAADSNVVLVDPPPGTRVAIMRGRDTTITVVWFSSASSRY